MEVTCVTQLDECINWMVSNNFSKVALQFPESLLKFSVFVVKYLRDKTASHYDFFVVYSDTCSVDYMSPLHLGENVVESIIRFGHVCLAPVPETVSEIPVLFVLTLNDYHDLFDFIEEQLQAVEDLSDCLVMYDVQYINIIQKLVSNSFINIDNVCKLKCHSKNWHFTSNATQFIATSENNSFSYGEYVIGRKLEDFKKIVYIGSRLSVYYRVSNVPIIHCLNPIEKRTNNIIPSSELRKRVACIEKVKSNVCRKIGIIYTNSYPSPNFDYLKNVSMKAGKEVVFISLVQSTDECKLGNFSDVDAFVIVTQCYCSSIIENIKFHVPILNELEFEISCGMRRKYAGVEWYDEQQNEIVEEHRKQIVEVNESNKNTWFGLEIDSKATAPSIVKEGQSGIATYYESEPH